MSVMDAHSAMENGYRDAMESLMKGCSVSQLMNTWVSFPNGDYRSGWKKFLSNEDGCLGRMTLMQIAEEMDV